MSLETEIARLASAANTLTQEVTGKIGAINTTVNQKIAELQAWRENARAENPYVNLLQNATFTETNANGALVNIPVGWIHTDVADWTIVTSNSAGVPATVRAWMDSQNQWGVTKNVMRVHFNQIRGYFFHPVKARGVVSTGFQYFYVANGEFAGKSAGQEGDFVTKSFSHHHSGGYWPAGTDGAVVYFGLPFVCAGVCTDASLVVFLQSM